MSDVTNVKMGVCSATFGSDLGHTKGGVVVIYTPDIHDTTVDKYGSTVVEKYVVGESLIARVPLAESTLANLAIAIPAGDDAAIATKLTLGRDAGFKLSDEAAELVLHPIANAANDLSEDVVLYSAVANEAVELAFKVDGEKIFEVTFVALIDESKNTGNYLGLIGDSS